MNDVRNLSQSRRCSDFCVPCWKLPTTISLRLRDMERFILEVSSKSVNWSVAAMRPVVPCKAQQQLRLAPWVLPRIYRRISDSWTTMTFLGDLEQLRLLQKRKYRDSWCRSHDAVHLEILLFLPDPVCDYGQAVSNLEHLNSLPLYLYRTRHDYFAERSRPSSAGIGRSAWGVIRAPWRVSPDSLKSTIADCIKISINLKFIGKKSRMYVSSNSVIPNNNCVRRPLDTGLIVRALVDMIVQKSQDWF